MSFIDFLNKNNNIFLQLKSKDIIGYSATLLSILVYVAEVIVIYSQDNASSVGLPMFIVTILSEILWTLYGFMLHSIPLIISSVITIILSFIIIIRVVTDPSTSPIIINSSSI